MHANYRSSVLAIGLLFASSASTSAAPGDLDPTFGNGGIVIASGGTLGAFDNASAMVIQSDGKIVVVGDGISGSSSFFTIYWDFAVVRYNPDGSLDGSFGGTGVVFTQLTSNYDGASAVAIQADGKIVAAGSVYDDAGGSSFAVVRYNPDGSLDTSFNGTGTVITSAGSFRDFAQSVAIQVDGKIVVAGRSALLRYNTDGSLDTSFNGTGKVITQGYSGAVSVAIQADGKIIAGGSPLVRYNLDGTPDTSFDASVGAGYSVAIQSDGKVVTVGGDGNGFAVIRLNPNGSLDSSFGGTGHIAIPVGNSDSSASSVAIQKDGKIVVAGTAKSNNVESDFAVVRLNPNGSLDTTFNGTGKVITRVSTFGNDVLTGAAIQADGKIVVTGMSEHELYDFYDHVVVRYQGDDATPAACPNPVDCTDFFVRQHYRDFLGREPDGAGLQFWTNEIASCGADAQCVEVKRINVSAAFFLAIEFQETGFFVFKAHRAAFGNLPGKPVPVVRETFLPEMRSIAAGVVVGIDGWQGRLESNKSAYVLGFVQRPDFLALYPRGMTAAEFVDALNATAGGVLDDAERNGLVADLTANNTDAGRAAVLRRVAEDGDIHQRETNSAFVYMQYAGYLQRDPDDVGFDGQADPNFLGYNFWLGKLNDNQGDFRRAEMVRAFIESIEYRQRFGQ